MNSALKMSMSLSVIITLKIPVILNSLKRNSKGMPSRDIKVKQISDKLVKSQHATHEPELAARGCKM